METITKLAIPVALILYICMGAMFATIWREYWKRFLAINCFLLSAVSIFALIKMAANNKAANISTIDEISNHFFDDYYFFIILFIIFFVIGCILFLQKPQKTKAPTQERSFVPQKYPSAPQQTNIAASPTTQHIFTELVNWKELLDKGIITQEEFDQKKKQLLDLPSVNSIPANAPKIGKCVVCGCENIPVENVEVVVAGMSRKRSMCSTCAARFTQSPATVPPQKADSDVRISYTQKPSQATANPATPSIPSPKPAQHKQTHARIWIKLGITTILGVLVLVFLTYFAGFNLKFDGFNLNALDETDSSPNQSQEEGNPVAKAALEKLVSIVKANNDTDAYQNVNGKASTYFMRPLYASAYSTSKIGFRYDDWLDDAITLNTYGRDFPSLYLYTDISFDEDGIMKVYYSFYVKHFKTTTIEYDRIMNGTVNIPVKDFSPTVDFNLSSPDIVLKAKWLATDMDISELGGFVKDRIREHIFMMLDKIRCVSDISLEDLGFYEGIENDVPEIYYRGNDSVTTEETTVQTSNEEASDEELIAFLHELIPINNRISELHMTITFGVTMNGIVDYDQLTDLIAEYTAVTELVCTLAEEPVTDEKIEIFYHYQKLIDRLDQFGKEYDSTTSESTRAIYWKNFHSYFCDWQTEWFMIENKYWSNSN